MDARDLEGLGDGERRQYGRYAPGEHGLAGAGAADHEDVVSSGDGDLERVTRLVLSLDVGEVVAAVAVGGDERGEVGAARLDRQLAVEILHGVLEGLHGDDVDSVDDARLLDVLRRDDDGAAADAPCLDHHRQDAAHAPDLAGERELADERAFVEALVADAPGGLQQADGDRQVVDRAFLADVGRREIDGDVELLARGKPLVLERGGDPVLRLLDCGVGEADNRELRRPHRRVDLDLNRLRVDPADRARIAFRKHLQPPFRLPRGRRGNYRKKT